MTAPDKLGGAKNPAESFRERFPNAVFEPISPSGESPDTPKLSQIEAYDRDLEEYKEYFEAALDRIKGSLAILESGKPEDITNEVLEDLRKGAETFFRFGSHFEQYAESLQNGEEPTVISGLSAAATKLLATNDTKED